jgi:hypothetical protein
MSCFDNPSLRAYIGRDPDGAAFLGYTTDAATETILVEQDGPWTTVDDALAWARARASQVVLTYGFTDESVFSGGATYYGGGSQDSRLPVWPPSEAERRILDEQVRKRVAELANSPQASSERLGVAEPEIRTGSTEGR